MNTMGIEPNMEILVLGGMGMLGHKMFQRLQQRFPGTYCTIRGSGISEAERKSCDFQNGRVVECVDATDFASLEKLLQANRPRVIVNCIGIVKQRAAAKDAVASITVNSLLPHKLAEICRQWGGRLIHFSTDCVFSGNRGGYSEEDFADADDLYGRTKFLGEVTAGNTLTLRTSIIGRELAHFASLLEWFLSQNHGKVTGYKKAFFSGVTTNWLAEVVGDLIETHPDLSGLYQITSPTISKFDLLCVLREAYDLDIEILPDDEFWCDRSMTGEKFARDTGYVCPPWRELALQLADDTFCYDEWRVIRHESI
jgi:dTDP-4-dehydrorhamnose reductase